jgi:predicted dehydrogenase
MSETKTIKWGIIGVGDVCEVKSGPALQNVEGSELVAVMRRNAELAEDFAKRHGVPKWYSDADDLINDPEVNAIYIATPPSTHQYYALKAAAASKIVYVEKPMALTFAETHAMIEACKSANVPLYVAFYRRALPNFLKIKELLSEKVIGDVRFVNISLYQALKASLVGGSAVENNWRSQPEIAGGGYFHDLACHQLDALDYLFGPIIKANGISKNQAGAYNADDIVIGNFEFESGVFGTGTWCFSVAQELEIEKTTIVGSKGQISFSYFGDHSVLLEVEGQALQKFTFDISKHIQQPFIQTMIDELKGIGKCESTGISAARTSWVMDKICGLY